MAFLSYEQVAVTDVVKTAADLHIPAGAKVATLQAETQNMRYTMDGVTDPTQTSGMILKSATVALVGDPCKDFPIEDLEAVRFCRGAASDGLLNIHYRKKRNIT